MIIEPALEPLQARIRKAVTDGTPLRVRGGGTKDFYGGPHLGDVLETGSYAGIVDYQPTELVITARAGTSLAAIEAAMSARGQMLGFEPPHYGEGATLGGAIASGLSGPRRPYAGAVRDFLLGVRILDGIGQDLAFGGRVMKNVAGFDVSRLMAGALGTLGIITEVSLKCLPCPKAQATLAFECSAGDAIRLASEWGTKPLPVSATCFHQGQLRVRLSGAGPAVDAAVVRMRGETIPVADGYWASLRNHTHSFFADARAAKASLWRLSVKATAPYTDLGGAQLIEWGGALRWLAASAATEPQRVRQWSAANGGHATLFHATDKSGGVFQPLTATTHALHARLKSAFDPHGILNRGRLYPEF
jgi:glycolate oxidase FAD binding subunit